MNTPTVRDIVKQYLIDHDYDGLYNDNECGCTLEDLASCSNESILDCIPGVKTKCPNGDFWIRPGKEEDEL
jgi:hypothetical protein